MKFGIKNNIALIYVFSELLIPDIALPQTFTGTGGWIPDNGNSIDFIINVSGLSPSNIDYVFGLESVCIDATHTWDSDLDISLVAPDGTTILLTSANGGDGDDYTNTCFTDSASLSIVSGSPPFTGTFKPQGQLGIVNNGQDGNGIWTLHILDTYAWADDGYLWSWSLTFGNNPSIPFKLDSSNLPIVVINTFGQPIPDEPKISGTMGIIWKGYNFRNYITDSFNHYSGNIGIELRGSSSQWFPQKSYGIETQDSAGSQADVSLLTMPAEHDWILQAPYDDKSCMRNVLTFLLARQLGYYAPRTHFCEVIVNNQYMGIYVLTEKIKRDPNRVDIAKLLPTDTAGDELTGGYIVKIDKQTGNGGAGWDSPYPPPVNPNGQTIYFQYHYPKDADITGQQKTYIQAYVDSFETALASGSFADPFTGFRKYCDPLSFMDMFILNEVSNNIDGYRLSTFLFKNKSSQGGKLVAGPVWDFNLAYWNANYCGGDDLYNWAYKFGDICSGDNWQLPFWWDRFLQDSVFTNELRCRYEHARVFILDTSKVFYEIDSMVNYISEAAGRHFTQWPILGVYTWPNPSPIPTTWQGEIDNLKWWLRGRLAWLDVNMPGNCVITSAKSQMHGNAGIYIIPNPCTSESGLFVINPESRDATINIYNNCGILVFSSGQQLFVSGQNIRHIRTDGFQNGVYFIRITNDHYDHLIPFVKSD